MNVYHIPDEDKAKIRVLFNVSDEELTAQLKALKEWMTSHFSNYSAEEHFLYAMLVRNKFKEDNVKKSFENYFRGIIKYGNVFQNLGQCKPSELIGAVIPCPKLTKDFERIIVLKLLPENMPTKTFDVRQLLLAAITTGTFLYNHDDAASLRLLIDLKGFTMMHLLRIHMGIADTFKLMSITQNVLKLRSCSGIELVNASRFVHALLEIARIILKPKLFLRITVHSDMASLSENIPTESLPSDYGGEYENTQTLLEKWDHTVEEQKFFFQTVAAWSKMNVNKA